MQVGETNKNDGGGGGGRILLSGSPFLSEFPFDPRAPLEARELQFVQNYLGVKEVLALPAQKLW